MEFTNWMCPCVSVERSAEAVSCETVNDFDFVVCISMFGLDQVTLNPLLIMLYYVML